MTHSTCNYTHISSNGEAFKNYTLESMSFNLVYNFLLWINNREMLSNYMAERIYHRHLRLYYRCIFPPSSCPIDADICYILYIDSNKTTFDVLSTEIVVALFVQIHVTIMLPLPYCAFKYTL